MESDNMKTIINIGELKANIALLEKYLDSKTDPEYSFAINLVKNGICFVVVQNNAGYKFFPSRFIGYANNSMNKHINNEDKDGKETNPVISRLLGGTPKPNLDYERLYREYCESLGFISNNRGSYGVERKYWSNELL
jgi:hypothetical protein